MFHLYLKHHEVAIIIPISQWGNWSAQALNILFKVTKDSTWWSQFRAMAPSHQNSQSPQKLSMKLRISILIENGGVPQNM